MPPKTIDQAGGNWAGHRRCAPQWCLCLLTPIPGDRVNRHDRNERSPVLHSADRLKRSTSITHATRPASAARGDPETSASRERLGDASAASSSEACDPRSATKARSASYRIWKGKTECAKGRGVGAGQIVPHPHADLCAGPIPSSCEFPGAPTVEPQVAERRLHDVMHYSVRSARRALVVADDTAFVRQEVTMATKRRAVLAR